MVLFEIAFVIFLEAFTQAVDPFFRIASLFESGAGPVLPIRIAGPVLVPFGPDSNLEFILPNLLHKEALSWVLELARVRITAHGLDSLNLWLPLPHQHKSGEALWTGSRPFRLRFLESN